MVEHTGTDRAAIQAELVAMCEGHIANFDSYTEVINDHAKGHFARYGQEQGQRLTVAKYRSAGLTMEQIHNFYANILENATKINPAYKQTKVAEEGHHNIYHTDAKAPWPISNRSTFTCEYKIEHDGGFTYIQSSKGCDAYIA